MPVIKSAKKKLQQDQKRTRANQRTSENYKNSLKTAKENPTKKSLAKAQSALDKAAKKQVIHKNKAARLKGQLARHAQN